VDSAARVSSEVAFASSRKHACVSEVGHATRPISFVTLSQWILKIFVDP